MDYLDSRLFDLLEDSLLDSFLFVSDLGTDRTRISKNLSEYFDIPGPIVDGFGAMWEERIHLDDRDYYREDISKLMELKSMTHDCEYRILNSYGDFVWVRCRGKVMIDAGSGRGQFAGVITKISGNAKFDPVTELYSLYSFRKDLSNFLTENMTDTIGLLLLGIDEFSYINQKYGYIFGNKVMKAIGRLFTEICSGTGTVYKMDGDKYMFLCPHSNREDLYELYYEVSRRIRNSLEIDGHLIRLTCAAGAVLCPDDGRGVELLQKNVSYALDEAKKTGKGMIRFFTEEISRERHAKAELINELRESIRNGFQGFSLQYQPILRREKNIVDGCEALLRWTDREGEMISPAVFIPILEETGDIRPVGNWVLSEALDQLEKWDKFFPGFSMGINVSYLQFASWEFAEHVIREVKKRKVDSSRVVLELTESCKVTKPDELCDMFRAIRREGIGISLDDFGTEYSAFSLLRYLPTDFVKIAHNFVKRSLSDKTDRLIIEHIISLCHQLDIEVVVEGIENQELDELMKSYEPELLQGYYYSRPIEPEEFEKKYFSQKKE